jgi:hypothetical protein
MEAGSLAELALPLALLHSPDTPRVNLQYLRLHKCLLEEALTCTIDELVSSSRLHGAWNEFH